MSNKDVNFKTLNDSTIERMIKVCEKLNIDTVKRVQYHGMEPYNLWIALSKEQSRRQILRNKTHCTECGRKIN